MYRKSCHDDELPEIGLYFEGRLNPENRWVKMAKRLPWQELEVDYTKHFKSCGRGEVALNVRVAMGALLIKEILGLSDRAVVDAVSENPYLQYFLGFKHFQTEPPFNASLMTHFRKRLPAEVINRFNEKVIELARRPPPEDDPSPDGGDKPAPDKKEPEPANAGTILMDATCAPTDIKYPTDLNLVNDARELTEQLIDQMRKQQANPSPRPRIRVIHLVHDQQREMLDRKSRRVEHRIVSLHQPHVRPIVRGKAGRETEFGAKLTASLENGYTRIERLSWEAYNEAADLQTICERYKERNGHYPEAVLADKLFRNRENLRYCSEHGIRLSGPKLGRPTKVVDSDILRQQLADNSARNAIEGKFGQCKRRFGLGRVMARRKDSSETVIAITILTANLIRWEQEAARLLFFVFPTICWESWRNENIEIYRMAA